MTFTVSMHDLLVGLLLLAGTGALVSLMILFIKAIPGIKNLNKVLENAATLTDEAVEGVDQAKELVVTLKDTANDICDAAKGKAGSVKSAIQLAKGVAGFVNMFKKDKEDPEAKK